MSPRLVIVGAPGAGKTTVGELLAQRWGTGFADSDHLVEKQSGSTVADIFVLQGEDAFRALERDAVAQAVEEHDGVLALGGGAVLDPSTRLRLTGLPVVLLTVAPGAAASRIGLNRDRPLLLGNVRGRLMTLMNERSAYYAEVARWTVATDELDPAAVADEVERLMAQGAA
jgi:shikimate kinase